MSKDNYHVLAKAGKPGAPLVFAFHGTGGDETQFFGLAEQILPEASIVSPRGDISEMGAARFFRRAGEGVYDMADLARATKAMAAFVAAHKASHPNAPVYGFGYSNGANILASVLMAEPGLFDRAALLHPLIPWQPDPVGGLSGLKVLITAGRRDPICPWPQSEALFAWFKDQGAGVRTETHGGGHDLRQSEIEALAEFLKAPALEDRA